MSANVEKRLRQLLLALVGFTLLTTVAELVLQDHNQ